MNLPPSPPVWRSVLFVPATSDRFADSAVRQPADALQIDLEDSVAPGDKALARQRLPGLADRFRDAGYDVLVRLNRPWRQLVRDAEAAVRASVAAVTLPKVPDASHVRAVAEVLAECEAEACLAPGHTRIVAMVEDAEGLANMQDIARAHARVCGMIVGAEDLAVSLRMAADADGLYVPNVMAVAACRRAGIAPIGFVGSVADFADADAFRAAIRRARRLGFESAFCIHPRQVPIVNQEFAPQPDEVAHAEQLLEEFERQARAGLAAFTFKGRMVDMPVVQQARQLLERHRALAARAAQGRGHESRR